MREGSGLPSGTVTFLFTDIEHSTQSAEALGDERWADVLQMHRDLLRPAFEKRGGVEVGTEGDAFFVAFASAHDAIEAALDGQLALETHDWPGETQLRVRMGVHTGEALVRGGDYVGHEVHRAKRISDAGHGGQVLVSDTTADLVRSTRTLVPLGPHRLKDLGEPQLVFQVADERLQREFPRLRSLDAFTHSLPQQRSAFIGREREIAELRDLIAANRLVTLTGVGGCGKTRLALQVGAEELESFPDGVFFVNLAPVSDPDVVIDEVASSVGVPMGGAMPAGPAGRPNELVLRHLGQRVSLLIIDNCEHLVDVCAEVTDRILAGCPSVKILATSREALRVEGEQAWNVPSLTLPQDDTDARESESVSLFKARATSVRPEFELTPDNTTPVTEICRRLDGIPLAIEFAAARVNHLSPRQIAERLDDRFRLLTGGQRRVQRQNTLQAALDWSYELLSEPERALLRRSSVFLGDFSIEAAEGICSDDALDASTMTDVLGALVSKSLVNAGLAGDEIRYSLLETVRAYAAQRLAHAQEAELFRTRHRDWYLSWLEAFSPEDSIMSFEIGAKIDLEESNVRAALEWSAATGRHDLVGRLAASSVNAWRQRSVDFRWIGIGLENADDLLPDDRLLLRVQAAIADQLVNGTASGDSIPDALFEGTSRFVKAWALMTRGIGSAYVAAFMRDDMLTKRAYADFDEAERLTADARADWAAVVQWSRAHAEMIFGHAAEAVEVLERAAERFEAAANNEMAASMFFYGSAALHSLGEDERARRMWAAARRPFPDLFDERDVALEISLLGPLTIFATFDGLTEGPASAWSFLTVQREPVLRSAWPNALDDLILGCAIVSAQSGDLERAAVLLSWVRAHTLAVGRPLPSGAHYLLYVRYRDLVRQELGADAAHQARERGERMNAQEVVEFAFAAKVPA